MMAGALPDIEKTVANYLTCPRGMSRAAMQVPSNWKTSKRQKTPRKSEGVRKKTKWASESEECQTLDQICNDICSSICQASKQPLSNEYQDLCFDSIITAIPYVQILEKIFGGTEAPMFKDVPILTRKTEESFMRECMYPGERRCTMGSQCECMHIDRAHPFVGVELLVGEQSTANCTPQMCVLCSRKYTQKLFYDMLYRPPSCNVGCSQRYGVITGVEDEYNPDATLVMPPNGPLHCMPFPSPAHHRNAYKVVYRVTNKYIVQSQDSAFRLPSLEIP